LGASLSDVFDKSVFDAIQPHWISLCQSINAVDSDSALGQLRLAFLDLCAAINGESEAFFSGKESALFQVFEWFLVHSVKLPSAENLLLVIASVSSLGLEPLSSILSLLQDLLAKAQARDDLELPLAFIGRVLGVNPPSHRTNEFNSFLPLFIECASQCFETGEISFNQQTLDSLRNGSATSLDEFSETLVISHELPFRAIAAAVELQNDRLLSSSVDLIFRGAFSPHSVAEFFRAVFLGKHWFFWKFVLEFSFFLCFLQTRDAIAGDFLMLRQVNLRMFGGIANRYLFLQTVFALPDSALLLSAARRLKCAVDRVPTTHAIAPALLAEVFLACSALRLAANDLDIDRALSSLSAELEPMPFFDVFADRIRPALADLRLPPELYAFLDRPLPPSVLDSFDAVVQAVFLAQHSDAIFAFFATGAAFLELANFPSPLARGTEAAESAAGGMSFSTASSRWAEFTAAQLRETAGELARIELPEVAIARPIAALSAQTEAALLRMLAAAQAEYEGLPSATIREGTDGTLARAVASLEVECRNFEAEIARFVEAGVAMRAQVLAEQREWMEEFSRAEAENREELRRQREEMAVLEGEIAHFNREIAAKKQAKRDRTASIRLLQESVRRLVRPGARQESEGIGSAVAEAGEEARAQDRVSEPKRVQAERQPHTQPQPQPETQVEPTRAETHLPDELPPALKKFVRGRIGLPPETISTIERSSKGTGTALPTARAGRIASADNVEAVLGDGAVTDLRAEIEEARRRVQCGLRLLAEIHGPD
jgi:hypothetical protein